MEDKVYPYLLKTYPPVFCNDVWQVDITYIRLGSGFVYLVAIIDVISRRVMGWDLSPFLETGSALAALDHPLSQGYKPWILNSDQGCQFTSEAWTGRLKNHEIAISMDGKGRCIDNIYIERFWRSIKYEEVYLKSYEDVKTARGEIGLYIEWYNQERPHQSLNNQTPNEAFASGLISVESGDNSLSYPPLPTDSSTTNECMLGLKINHILSSKKVA